MIEREERRPSCIAVGVAARHNMCGGQRCRKSGSKKVHKK